jgi:NitT/TauT family transport system substrate-binding protein
MYFSRRPFLSLFASMLLVALSLAACGGSGGTPSSTNSMTLKVAQVTNGISTFPLYVALQENFFKAQGLTLDPSLPPSMGSGSKLSTAVEAGGVEVGVGAITDAFTISRVDDSIKIIGALSNDYLLDIVVSKSFEQKMHLSATSALADKVKALEGKKIGISAPGSATDALVTYLFRQQGMDSEKDAVKVNLGAAIGAEVAALLAGRVDAIAVTAPGGELAETKGAGDIFISPTRGDVPSMQGQLFGVAYTKQSVIDAKPKAVQAFIRALAQAEDYIQKNPGQMVPLLIKYLKLDKKTLTLAWNAKKVSMPLSPQISQQAYDTTNQFHVQAGLIAIALAYKDLVASDTINNALSGMSSSS